MKVSSILQEIKETRGSIAKKALLSSHSDNDILKKALFYGLDNFTPFNVVKVPKVKARLEFPLSEDMAWQEFFTVADECATRKITGNAAIERVYTCFSSVEEAEEMWMRKILNKHLAIGASTKTVNSVFNGLIPTFDVSLAQKFNIKRLSEKTIVAVEPKLDGIRCFSIVENEEVKMFARSGKIIKNFENTIGKELVQLGDGCYDGELMGEDFTSIMRQAYRKEDLDTDGTYLALFDYLPLSEWKSRKGIMPCSERYETLLDKLSDNFDVDLNLVQPVEREECEVDYEEIKRSHDSYVSLGYEGAMIKDLQAPYRFGRGYEVMKLKAFHDVDLEIDSLEEGTGKHSGKLGSVGVVFNGVKVKVGSGFSDDVRDKVWEDPDSFIGRIIEVRYQEVTPDGSLRFPTFVCFRNDR